MRTTELPGSDGDTYEFERDAARRDFDPPQMEWDESEVSAIVDDIVARHSCAD